MEQWRAITGYEGIYEVSDLGRVRRISYPRNLPVPHYLTPIPDQNGYLHVTLSREGKEVRKKIHRLVMAAFKGPDPREVNHDDGDHGNNQFENLEYCTRSENELHKCRVLRKWGGPSGSKNHKALTLNTKKIFKMSANGMSNRAIARRLGLPCHKVIGVVLAGRHWSQR